MYRRTAPSVIAAAFAVLAARTAFGQLELPDKPVAQTDKGGGVTLPAKPTGDVAKTVEVTTQKTDGVNRSTANEKLDLPSSAPAEKPASATGRPPAAAQQPKKGEGTPPPAPQPNSAAEFVLSEVRKLKDIDNPVAVQAAESLLHMGPAGRDAANAALYEDNPVCVIVGARVLLQTGAAEDCERVQQRLRERLPTAACAPLVDTLAKLDPVHASPAFLAELLGHRQAGVRNAAQRQLDALGTELPLAAILPLLNAKESDVRLRGVQLLAASTDPKALPAMLERLGDPSAAVARRAVDALGARDDDRIDPELLRRAFSERWVLREQSYDLLAIMEREDTTLRPVLTDLHIASLLEGMASKDPFVSGTCAAALAGIGFRSPAVDATQWLDLEVPHRLVRVVGAEDFCPDYSSLTDTAVRRLALISGASLGSDGPGWLAWWAKSADKFHARRAVLTVRDEDVPTLRVALMSNAASNAGKSEAFCLLGPAFANASDDSAASDALQGETLFISDVQTRALLDLLRKQGVFEARRLPGTRGSGGTAGSTLTVGVAGRDKQFRFAGVAPEDWFQSCVEAVRALRERNRWQRYLAVTKDNSQRAAWLAESAWWDEAHTDAERDRRLTQMILVQLNARPASERDSGLAELKRLAAQPGALVYSDFAALVGLLRGEHFVGPRARTLLTLAIATARAGSEPPGVALPDEFVADLVSALTGAMGPSSAELLSQVFAAAGRDTTRRYAADKEPFLRAVAAATLARDARAEDLDVLLRLLDDPVEDVQAAAVLALGENRVEAARTPVLIRARVGKPAVRANALIAVGMLGGDNALDALLSGLAERDQPAVYVAAARGLALLHDPQTTPLLISLLSKGNQDPAFEYARRGLLDLGEVAWSDLLRVVHTPGHKALREAALILSEQCVPQAASALMTYFTDHKDDARVATELTVLTCIDARNAVDPPVAWWNWWEGVVHDDAQAWFCAAVARLGISTPTPEALRGGERDVLLFLINVLQRPEPYLAERARREVARTLGRDPGPLPQPGVDREAWIATLREAVDARAAAPHSK